MYMQQSPRFEINRIGVRGHSRLLPQRVVQFLDIPPHTNIFHVQIEKLQQQLETLQWVKTARVYRNFPDKLSITLIERTPFALVKLDELHLVDRDGFILGNPASENALQLPIITGAFVEDINIQGENPRFGQALHAINEVMNSSIPLFHQIRTIHIQSLENVTFLSDSSTPEIRVSLVDYRKKLGDLQKIYDDVSQQQLALIDLRFKKRIIISPQTG